MALYLKFVAALALQLKSYCMHKFGLGHADFWASCATA